MRNREIVREANKLFESILVHVSEGPDAVGWLEIIKEAAKGYELTMKEIDPYLKKERGE